MPHFIVSSIGTSLITNSMPPAERQGFFSLSNKVAGDLTTAERARIDAVVSAARSALEKADAASVKRLSAELNGVLCLIGEMGNPGPVPLQHMLIGTDTYAGRSTAELVAEWLRKRGDSVVVHVPDDLRTVDLAEFRAALADLVQHLLPLIDDYRARGYEVTFNLTGGFKGVPGFLQALATVAGAEAVYVFEGSPALMRIPRLPLKLDAEVVVGRNFELFRKLGAKIAQPIAIVQQAGVPETLLLMNDGEALLSEWGEVLWAQAWKSIASGKLLPSRTAKLRFDKRFEENVASFAKKESRRMLDVNNAVEGFTRRLEGTQAGALRSEKLQKLTNPHAFPGSTHELYAWSDGAPGRMFMHEENGVWSLDALAGHLPS